MIGMGFMIEGQAYRGSRYAASEIGDMIIDSSKQLAGGFQPGGGYLERWLSALGNDETLFAAKEGSEAARLLVEEDQVKIAVCLANIICMFDPEQLIVGGTILQYQDMFLPRIRALVTEITGRVPSIKTAHYKEDSELIGSIHKAIQSLQQKISIKQHTF